MCQKPRRSKVASVSRTNIDLDLPGSREIYPFPPLSSMLNMMPVLEYLFGIAPPPKTAKNHPVKGLNGHQFPVKKTLFPPFSRMLSTVVVLKMTSDPHQPLHRSKLTPESFFLYQAVLTSLRRGKFSGEWVGDGISDLALSRPFTGGSVNFKSLQIMP
ncbi:hypothetical protein NQ318_011104 [Aromia moschata]|uniref:Uncharacterized protein n=1 Tax=Aromia moschata TaxID=1265417 RepID=A0AAV8YSA3_9CUCU|nr:hypothetical protein NQ318_011104 [Aromia moschata]